MGLDISAYPRLVPAPGDVAMTDGEPDDWQSYFVVRRDEIEMTEAHFPGATEGLTPGVYRRDGEFGFRAGSYGGYNQWRDQLARLAGWSGATAAWDDPKSVSGPFGRLINFSDCEGYIGPAPAAKLAADFAEYQHAADRHPDEWFREQYSRWRKAFEMAADGGLVDFH